MSAGCFEKKGLETQSETVPKRHDYLLLIVTEQYLFVSRLETTPFALGSGKDWQVAVLRVVPLECN